jgi:hypothetical protein
MRLKFCLRILSLVIALAVFAAAQAEAAKRKKPRVRNHYPYSIMNEEPGARPARANEPWVVNPGHSPLTPLGRAPTVAPVKPLGQPASPPAIVPGVTTNTGIPAITPPRPAGQSFQDRSVNCVHGGSAGGVGAGQIGAYTRGCVN